MESIRSFALKIELVVLEAPIIPASRLCKIKTLSISPSSLQKGRHW